MLHWVLVILRFNAIVAIGIMLGFSLVMLAILALKGYLALSSWIFSGVGKAMNPAQKPSPVPPPVTKLVPVREPLPMKCLLQYEYGIWEVLGCYWFRDTHPISDLTPETETLLSKMWSLLCKLGPYRVPINESLKAQGITNGLMQLKIAQLCLLENPETEGDQMQLNAYAKELEDKIKGGNQLC